MKRKRIFLISLSLIIIIVLIIAVITKPSDKEIKIEVVDALWGKWVPNKNLYPAHYEEFMDIVTKDIEVEDWIFLKRIKDSVKDSTITVGYAVFGTVIYTK